MSKFHKRTLHKAGIKWEIRVKWNLHLSSNSLLHIFPFFGNEPLCTTSKEIYIWIFDLKGNSDAKDFVQKKTREIKRFTKFPKNLYILRCIFWYYIEKIASTSASYFMLPVCMFTVCVYASVEMIVKYIVTNRHGLRTLTSVSKRS